jgi:hypothetical protein
MGTQKSLSLFERFELSHTALTNPGGFMGLLSPIVRILRCIVNYVRHNFPVGKSLPLHHHHRRVRQVRRVSMEFLPRGRSHTFIHMLHHIGPENFWDFLIAPPCPGSILCPSYPLVAPKRQSVHNVTVGHYPAMRRQAGDHHW